MLHTVNKSPFSNGALDDCLRFAKAGDSILLLEDGVYAAAAGSTQSDKMAKAIADYAVYAISADVSARGLKRIMDGVKVINYGDFVDLVEKNLTHSWM